MNWIPAAFLAAALCLLFTVSRAEPATCPYDIHLSITYNYLSDAERLLFDRMYDALMTGGAAVSVPDGVAWERAQWMLDFIYNEAPELCAYDRWASRLTASPRGPEICLAYKMPLREQDRFIRSVPDMVRFCAGMDEKSALRAIHERLSSLFEYGTVDGEDTQLAYFALKNGRAICNGYAQTFVLFAHFAGCTASYVDGDLRDGRGRHAWNIACENGRYFWLDATWDDAGQGVWGNWYGLSADVMFRDRIPDPRHQAVLALKTVLPDHVTFTMHLDADADGAFSRGISSQSGTAVRLKDLSQGEYYTPSMVIWNGGVSPAAVAVSCAVNGRRSSWGQIEVPPGSNLPFRLDASHLRGLKGSFETVWYCGGIRLGAFSWQVI